MKKLSDLTFTVKPGVEEMNEFSFNEKLYNVMKPFMQSLSEEMTGLLAGDAMAFYMNVAEIVAKNSIITLQNATNADINLITTEFCNAIWERIAERDTANKHHLTIGLQ